MEFDQIIVGAGTSAFTFLHAALHGTQRKFVRKKTLVIGKGANQLWARIKAYDPDHKMGQPPTLLRPSGLPGPRIETSRFLKTSEFNDMLDELKAKVDRDRAEKQLEPLAYVDEHVRWIDRSGGGYCVCAGNRLYFAKQVIVACGPGRGMPLEQRGVSLEGPVDQAKQSGEYIDAVDYMTTAQPGNKRVLILS